VFGEWRVADARVDSRAVVEDSATRVGAEGVIVDHFYLVQCPAGQSAVLGEQSS
jgi:hypothetical protein